METEPACQTYIKILRKKVPHVELEIKTVPNSIMNTYRAVSLCVDDLFVNGIQFLTSISRSICFATSATIKDEKIDYIADSLH